jgi:hypothetical protein
MGKYPPSRSHCQLLKRGERNLGQSRFGTSLNDGWQFFNQVTRMNLKSAHNAGFQSLNAPRVGGIPEVIQD